jgi:YHS domain-containing protein
MRAGEAQVPTPNAFRRLTMRTLISRLFLLAAAFALIGCSAMTANTIADGGDAKLMLQGHDPVGYFTAGKHLRGDPTIKTVHEGLTYRFVNEENKQAFLKAPDKYKPQYGGFCSNGIVYAIPWGGDADTWEIINDKLYIFGGHGSKNYFMMDQKNNLALADKYWAEEVNGKNAFIQRYKRLAFRVPHYKSGEALEAEWQARQTQAPK